MIEDGVLRQRMWRFAVHWQYRLFKRRRYGRLVLEDLDGLPLVVLPRVFNPKLLRSGHFLVQQLRRRELLPPASRVLDLGTGSGAGAVAAARKGCRVVAVDINPEAVRCATINALLNHVESHVETRQGDLFVPVADERFDVILFNPPFYVGAPRDPLDAAWRSLDVPERFSRGLAAHLTDGAHALLVLSSDGVAERFLNALHTQQFQTTLVAQHDFHNEQMVLYRVARAC